ncbi:mitochondrial cardiolipin hydrolase [Cuculus canorus]|uniref:mitochondrial cardiolipin hydrolase n=1 Tax=Cuculus canorus TaxID=55661 RepID=UPI0023AAF4A4|nr:mitochondrial cardiolipin hydrolase [Cuculus canorus]
MRAALAAAALLLLLLLMRRRRRRRREVLFFPAAPRCPEALLSGSAGPCPCPLPPGDSGLLRLLRLLLGARRSLDVCVFAFSSPELGRALQLLHRQGVRVRVLTDSQYMGLPGSQVGLLRRHGIQVRHDQDSGFMHHKFAVVDKQLLITGSLNWTTQAIQNNRENVLVTEDTEFVKPFLDEFERIWEEFNPINYSFFSKDNK